MAASPVDTVITKHIAVPSPYTPNLHIKIRINPGEYNVALDISGSDTIAFLKTKIAEICDEVGDQLTLVIINY